MSNNDDLFTRPAVWEDVIGLVRHLTAHDVEYALVGGYALAAHGLVRMTEDIDILVEPSAENSVRWIAALSDLPDGAARELAGKGNPFSTDSVHALRVNDEFTIDVMPRVCGHSYDDLKTFVVMIDIDGVRVPVLNLKGLLLTKQGDRPKDQNDARIIQLALSKK